MRRGRVGNGRGSPQRFRPLVRREDNGAVLWYRALPTLLRSVLGSALAPSLGRCLHHRCVRPLRRKISTDGTFHPVASSHGCRSHRLCAKLLNRRTGSCERIVRPLFSTLLVSYGTFPVLGACPAVTSDWVFLSALIKGYRLN